MIINSENINEVRVAARIAGASDVDTLSEEKLQEVLLGDGEYVSRVANFKRSRAGKNAWAAKRPLIQAGIDRFQRTGVPDHYKEMKKRVRKYAKKQTKGSVKSESYILSLPEYDRYEILRDLSLLEGDLCTYAAEFAMVETYTEKVVFVDASLCILSELKKVILEGLSEAEIPKDMLDTVFDILGEKFVSSDKLTSKLDSGLHIKGSRS